MRISALLVVILSACVLAADASWLIGRASLPKGKFERHILVMRLIAVPAQAQERLARDTVVSVIHPVKPSFPLLPLIQEDKPMKSEDGSVGTTTTTKAKGTVGPYIPSTSGTLAASTSGNIPTAPASPPHSNPPVHHPVSLSTHMAIEAPKLLGKHGGRYYYGICFPVHWTPTSSNYMSELMLRFATVSHHRFALKFSRRGAWNVLSTDTMLHGHPTQLASLMLHDLQGKNLNGFDDTHVWSGGRFSAIISSDSAILAARLMIQAPGWKAVTPKPCTSHHHHHHYYHDGGDTDSYVSAIHHAWQRIAIGASVGLAVPLVAALILILIIIAVKKRRERHRAQQGDGEDPDASAPSVDDFELIESSSDPSGGYPMPQQYIPLATTNVPSMPPPPPYEFAQAAPVKYVPIPVYHPQHVAPVPVSLYPQVPQMPDQ